MVQQEFPLVARPYRAIAERLGIGEDEVIARLDEARRARVLRQICAIYDTRRLGYRGMLVAMAVRTDALDEVADLVSRHPGVSHNYARDHRYNLWFTIAVPPDRDVRAHVEAMARHPAVEDHLLLPTLRLYKIGVQLDMTGEEDPAGTEAVRANTNTAMTAEEIDERCKAIVRETQEDLASLPEPFAPIAARLGITVEDLFARLEEYRTRGIMRRFAALLRHQHAGFTVNVMAVWRVPEERIDELGPRAASVRAVSHCYRRPVYPEWPYNLFTMIHARTVEEAERVVAAIREVLGTDIYARLYTVREYKKTRLKYFTDDLARWEREFLSS
jgi:DNA-binding Lrp family transcriptional regulator